VRKVQGAGRPDEAGEQLGEPTGVRRIPIGRRGSDHVDTRIHEPAVRVATGRGERDGGRAAVGRIASALDQADVVHTREQFGGGGSAQMQFVGDSAGPSSTALHPERVERADRHRIELHAALGGDPALELERRPARHQPGERAQQYRSGIRSRNIGAHGPDPTLIGCLKQLFFVGPHAAGAAPPRMHRGSALRERVARAGLPRASGLTISRPRSRRARRSSSSPGSPGIGW